MAFLSSLPIIFVMENIGTTTGVPSGRISKSMPARINVGRIRLSACPLWFRAGYFSWVGP